MRVSTPKSYYPVLIYRDQLLPYSETFILNQGTTLKRYFPYFVGSTKVGELESHIPSRQIVVIDEHVSRPAFWKTAYKLTGVKAKAWYEQVENSQPKLIHAHFGFDGAFATPLANSLNIPLLVTCHGYDVTLNSDIKSLQPPLNHAFDLISHRGRFFREQYLRRRPQLFESADRFIAVSDFIHKSLVKAGCSPEKVITHYIGIDVDEFCPKDLKRSQSVLFVGRLVEKKGLRYLIQAMSAVQKTIPDVDLIVVGDGGLRPHLEQLAKALNVNCEFIGKQPPSEVKTWMNKASVFCVPSNVSTTGDAEGLGMVFLEAQAMGLPVVSCHSGGIPEAVANGETGLLVPERDVHSLGKALTKLLSSSELRAKFGRAGRHRIKHRFNLEAQTAKLEEIYDLLLASRN